MAKSRLAKTQVRFLIWDKIKKGTIMFKEEYTNLVSEQSNDSKDKV